MTRKRRFKNEKYDEKVSVPHQFKAETNADNTQSTIVIYGEIGESWFGESTTAGDVENALKNITSSEIIVRLNSPGGSAFDGIAIYNLLKTHSAKIIIYIDGWAASAASIIAMAADVLIINIGGMLMIHEASTGMWGFKEDFEKEAVVLGKLNQSLIDIYMTRFKGERPEIETMVSNETWFTASEAVDFGLADSVGGAPIAPVQTDPEDFKNSVLARFRNKQTEPNPQSTPEQPKNILNQFKRD
ncbi:head maturation protease, ClpP-related [Sporosarcina sp. E16_8]|uniref:head maturation protease, ClpP-related n=1 Tax=Sporosarcina sp. E16_8 TaxID=2789295 RepID=UPI001A9336D7|nr:head maturation protease, ClpP-related [Sporosarcina sp. E16_8]MBO0586464.1 Clp protease ClpP [Sporosarcina sp. E16_8]